LAGRAVINKLFASANRYKYFLILFSLWLESKKAKINFKSNDCRN
jgi:hypothetical protein